MIELLAAHAAIAITNAGLYERSRELSMLAERNRLALELHDAVSQKLFSLVLTAEAAGDAARRATPQAARAQVGRGCGRWPREALEELRSLILELRPPELERDGLCGALRKHVEVLRRLHRRRRSSSTSTTTPAAAAARDREVLRIAQEALHNAVRHAGAGAAAACGSGARDGRAGARGRRRRRGLRSRPTRSCARARLGLTSMEERAQRLGGALEIRSAPGAGTTVRLEAPRWLTRRSAS